MIIGNTIVGDVLKDGFVLEEDWGKSYDDYRELEKKLNCIHFAYDGLKIEWKRG